MSAAVGGRLDLASPSATGDSDHIEFTHVRPGAVSLRVITGRSVLGSASPHTQRHWRQMEIRSACAHPIDGGEGYLSSVLTSSASRARPMKVT